METLAKIRVVLSVEGVPELQRTAEAFKQVDSAAKGAQRTLDELDKVHRRGAFAPGANFPTAPGLLSRAGSAGMAALGSVAGLITSHPLLTTAGAIFAAHQAVNAFGEEEMAIARTQAVLKAHGTEWDKVEKEITSTAKALQSKTLFSDERQIEALGTLITVTGDYKKSLQALSIVNDIAATTGLDLHGAALAYGRAMEGDISLLGRYVPALRQLKEEQRDEATILKTLQTALGGTAEAQAKTATGQLMQARMTIRLAEKEVGDALTKALAVPAGRLLSFMKSPEILFDLEGLRESNRVESEAFRRRFFPGQFKTEQWIKSLSPRRMSLDELSQDIVSRISVETTTTGGILALRKQISQELTKQVWDVDKLTKLSTGMLDLTEKESLLRKEIRGIEAQAALTIAGRVGTLTSAVKGLGGSPAHLGVEELFGGRLGPAWIPATGRFALQERFGRMRLAPDLTLSQALQEHEGVAGVDLWQSANLARLLSNKDLPAQFRAGVAQQFFQGQLAMMGQATTPEAQARHFGWAVKGMGIAQEADLAAAKEAVEQRQKLIGNTNNMVTLLGQIHRALLPQGVPKEVNSKS